MEREVAIVQRWIGVHGSRLSLGLLPISGTTVGSSRFSGILAGNNIHMSSLHAKCLIPTSFRQSCSGGRPGSWSGDPVSTVFRSKAYEEHLELESCRKLCYAGHIHDAIPALDLLVQKGCQIPRNLFYRVLKRCIAYKELDLGRHIHALVVKNGYEGDDFLATHLMGFYASHGRLEEAVGVFSTVSSPSVYSWATIIFACAKHGEAAQAVRLYKQMRESTEKPDNRIYVAVLKACAMAGDLAAGKEVHSHILASAGKPDIFVQTGLIHMYAKCGSLEDARSMFDKLPKRDVVTWTAMLAAYAQKGLGQEALTLYRRMQREGLSLLPNSVTYVCLLQACASIGVGALREGTKLHVQIEERQLQYDVVLGASLVNMYAKCGSLEDALRVFNRLPKRDLVTWNSLLAGYVLQEMGWEALSLHCRMRKECLSPPDRVTFVCLLQACAKVGSRALSQGKRLHTQIADCGLEYDVDLGGSLVNMYARCSSLMDARRLFDRLPVRNLVAWNAMLAGYVQQGMGQEALCLYSDMKQEGLWEPDAVTLVCLLQACAVVACLPIGKQLHAQAEKQGIQSDVIVGGALVNMYAKCGSMLDSQKVFDSLPERSLESWNALIGGFSHHGDSQAVFDLFERMRVEAVQPDGITFVCLLTVCSHVGLVEKGRKYYELMETGYSICPTVEHFTCMIDLLGRAGHLNEALQMAKLLPFSLSSAIWHTLLSACLKWKDMEIGQQAFEFAVRLDGKDAVPYLLMSNMYARAQMWDEATKMQATRVRSGAWKEPGYTWCTDIGGVVHTFVAGDVLHADIEGITNKRLEELVPELKKDGHLLHLHSSVRDVLENEEAESCGHSE